MVNDPSCRTTATTELQRQLCHVMPLNSARLLASRIKGKRQGEDNYSRRTRKGRKDAGKGMLCSINPEGANTWANKRAWKNSTAEP